MLKKTALFLHDGFPYSDFYQHHQRPKSINLITKFLTSGWFWSGSDVRLGSRNGKVGEICLHKRDKYQTRAKTNISAQIKRLYIENEQITALDL